MVWSGEWISAEYDTFQVQDGTINFYRIWVSGYSGDAGDSMDYAGWLTATAAKLQQYGKHREGKLHCVAKHNVAARWACNFHGFQV